MFVLCVSFLRYQWFAFSELVLKTVLIFFLVFDFFFFFQFQCKIWRKDVVQQNL